MADGHDGQGGQDQWGGQGGGPPGGWGGDRGRGNDYEHQTTQWQDWQPSHVVPPPAPVCQPTTVTKEIEKPVEKLITITVTYTKEGEKVTVTSIKDGGKATVTETKTVSDRDLRSSVQVKLRLIIGLSSRRLLLLHHAHRSQLLLLPSGRTLLPDVGAAVAAHLLQEDNGLGPWEMLPCSQPPFSPVDLRSRLPML